MNRQPQDIDQSSFRGWIGAARADITPPVGIYARSWGAATHDVAAGVHRALTLTCITFQSNETDPPLVLFGADLGWWRSREDEWALRGAILAEFELDESRLMFCLSHTHAGPALQTENTDRPGGHLIGPYQKHLRDAAIAAVRQALSQCQLATLDWRYGRCNLAANRDLPDPNADRMICGFNPTEKADDTLLVGRVTATDGRILATLVNYACHPTTLAWQNQLLSPDYVGAMRELVEGQTAGAPCLFLQGASGDLAPAEQYGGDPALSDRHGRRLGFAVLSTLHSMLRPGAKLCYRGVVESGAPLAIWEQVDAQPSSQISAMLGRVELALKPMPSLGELEQQWRVCDDPVQKERLWRKRLIRKVVGEGEASSIPFWVWRIGGATFVGQPNEAYSALQLHLRKSLGPRAVAVMNLTNGSAGYLPPADLYDADVYPVWQTPFARGSLERLIDSVDRATH